MTIARAFAIVAAIAGVIYAVATPPFQVPDEAGHFWRAAAIAEGDFVPVRGARGPETRLPKGYQLLVFHLWRDPSSHVGVPYEWERLARAREVRLDADDRVALAYPAGYTPLPSIPGAAACVAGRLLGFRPLTTFYLGRIVNLLTFILLVAFAMRIAPDAAAIFAAVATLPMALFMAASWSPDGPTIGFVFVAIAAALPPRGVAQPLTALLAALCKGYGLTGLLALAQRPPWKKVAAIVAAVIAGAVLSFAAASAGSRPPRADVPIDAAAQWRCITAEPLRFAAAIGGDFRDHGLDYIRQFAGRLGMLDVNLPDGLVAIAIAGVIAAALFAPLRPTRAQRITAAALFAVTAFATLLSQYLTWSIVCSDVIEGVQGRYFLPIAPLALVAVGGVRERAISPWVIAISGAALNVVACGFLVARYI